MRELSIEEIRSLKKKYGLSNAKLSDESGVPLGTVNKVLSGATAVPRNDTLLALAKPLLEREQEELSVPAKPQPLTAEQKEAAIVYKYRTAPSYSLVREEATAYGVPQHKGPGDFTIEDYLALSDDHRVELIDGVFYDMAAPTTIHQRIALMIANRITNFIADRQGGCTPFIAPVDVQFSPEDQKTIVQPDVLIVCDPSKIHTERIIGAPDFILEIISPSTSAKDYYRKSVKYQESGVREYWIIDPIRKKLTVYYFETQAPIELRPLEGKMGIGIFGNELEIDLDAVGALCK